jgi:hypothetical protein
VKTCNITVVIEQEGRNYFARCDEYPGVHGMGTTIREARASLLWALRIPLRQKRARTEPGDGGTDTFTHGSSN